MPASTIVLMCWRLYTAFCIVMALLCLAIGIMWVRGMWYCDMVARQSLSSIPTGWVLSFGDGCVVLILWDLPLGPESGLSYSSWRKDPLPAPPLASSLEGPIQPTTGEGSIPVAIETRATVFDKNYLLEYEYTARPFPGLSYESFTGLYRRVLVADWLLLLMATVPIGLWIVQARRLGCRRRRDRLARGLCLHCGYDLRATRERCPECGRPAPASRNAAAAPNNI